MFFALNVNDKSVLGEKFIFNGLPWNRIRDDRIHLQTGIRIRMEPNSDSQKIDADPKHCRVPVVSITRKIELCNRPYHQKDNNT
jgi:hypothetical protein